MDQKEGELSRAISAFSRRQIIRLLVEKEMTVKEIAQKTQQSVSLTSRHLTLLNDLGFLTMRISRPFKYYSIKIKELKDLIILYDKVIKKL